MLKNCICIADNKHLYFHDNEHRYKDGKMICRHKKAICLADNDHRYETATRLNENKHRLIYLTYNEHRYLMILNMDIKTVFCLKIDIYLYV